MAVAGKDAGLGVFEPQVTVFPQPVADRGASTEQLTATVREEEEVVYVAQIPRKAKAALDPVVESGEVDMGGEELAGVGADGQAAPGRRPVVRQPCPGASLGRTVHGAASIQDPIQYGQESAVTNAAGQETLQDVEIDGGEVGADVEMQGVAVAPEMLLEFQDGNIFLPPAPSGRFAGKPPLSPARFSRKAWKAALQPARFDPRRQDSAPQPGAKHR